MFIDYRGKTSSGVKILLERIFIGSIFKVEREYKKGKKHGGNKIKLHFIEKKSLLNVNNSVIFLTGIYSMRKCEE